MDYSTPPPPSRTPLRLLLCNCRIYHLCSLLLLLLRFLLLLLLLQYALKGADAGAYLRKERPQCVDVCNFRAKKNKSNDAIEHVMYTHTYTHTHTHTTHTCSRTLSHTQTHAQTLT